MHGTLYMSYLCLKHGYYTEMKKKKIKRIPLERIPKEMCIEFHHHSDIFIFIIVTSLKKTDEMYVPTPLIDGNKENEIRFKQQYVC